MIAAKTHRFAGLRQIISKRLVQDFRSVPLGGNNAATSALMFAPLLGSKRSELRIAQATGEAESGAIFRKAQNLEGKSGQSFDGMTVAGSLNTEMLLPIVLNDVRLIHTAMTIRAEQLSDDADVGAAKGIEFAGDQNNLMAVNTRQKKAAIPEAFVPLSKQMREHADLSAKQMHLRPAPIGGNVSSIDISLATATASKSATKSLEKAKADPRTEMPSPSSDNEVKNLSKPTLNKQMDSQAENIGGKFSGVSISSASIADPLSTANSLVKAQAALRIDMPTLSSGDEVKNSPYKTLTSDRKDGAVGSNAAGIQSEVDLRLRSSNGSQRLVEGSRSSMGHISFRENSDSAVSSIQLKASPANGPTKPKKTISALPIADSREMKAPDNLKRQKFIHSVSMNNDSKANASVGFEAAAKDGQRSIPFTETRDVFNLEKGIAIGEGRILVEDFFSRRLQSAKDEPTNFIGSAAQTKAEDKTNQLSERSRNKESNSELDSNARGAVTAEQLPKRVDAGEKSSTKQFDGRQLLLSMAEPTSAIS